MRIGLYRRPGGLDPSRRGDEAGLRRGRGEAGGQQGDDQQQAEGFGGEMSGCGEERAGLGWGALPWAGRTYPQLQQTPTMQNVAVDTRKPGNSEGKGRKHRA